MFGFFKHNIPSFDRSVLFRQSEIKIKASTVVINFFRYYILQQQKFVNCGDLAERTVETHITRYNKFASYLNFIDKPRLRLKNVNPQFAHQYLQWLKTKCGLSHNYAMKNIQMLNQLLNYAILEGKIKYNTLNSFKFQFKNTNELVYLDTEELHQLEKHSFKSDRLQRVADLFIFECYTGLAYSDAKNFNYNLNIYKGPDKRHWIHLNRQKSETVTMLPLLKKARSILVKYDFELPVISNQKYNQYLKEIAKIMDWDKHLTSHAARKTFAMSLLNDYDIPIETVSKMLGHRSIKTTQRHYARVLQKKIARDMKDIV